MGGLWGIGKVFSRDLFHLSECAQHATICLALGIAILRKPNTERTSQALVSGKWVSLHSHRLQAIKALKKELDSVKGPLSDTDLLNMMSMLSIVVSNIKMINYVLLVYIITTSSHGYQYPASAVLPHIDTNRIW